MSEGGWQIQIIGDAGTRSNLRALLDRSAARQYLVSEAERAAGGHRAAAGRAGSPDCILIACSPQGPDPLAELAALRGACPLPPFPVVVVCPPRADGRDLERAALRAGAQEILASDEPTPAALERAIEDAVERFASIALCAGPSSERPAAGERTEEARHESERFWRAVLDNLFAFVGVLAPDGTLLEVNRAPLEVTGIGAGEVLGKKLWDCIWWTHSPEVREELRAACERAGRGEVVRYDATARVARDAQMNIDFQISPLRDDAGRVTHLVPTAIDITEHTRAEEALRESEARFRALADNMSQLAWMSDEKGRIFWYNQRWIEYTGTTLDDMRSVGWPKVHHPDHVGRAVARIGRCFETGEPWEDTFPLRGKDGRYRWFLSRARPIRDEGGRLVWWIGTHTDITVQREAEEALRQAVKLRDEFLSVASHELRTPLTALSLQLEGLQRQLARQPSAEGARTAKRVETALRQSARLATLIEGLLSVSRIIAGRFRLELEQFDLAQVVDDTVERVSEIAARAGCEIRVAPAGAVVGTWDRSRLDQVLMNLLTNAIKYGPGQPVDVMMEALGDAVELRVQDRGIGISEEDQARIFGRFERAVPSTHYGGLGLGLYISREIVEAHGGSIRVESAPGSGSTFIVRLPRVARPRGEQEEAPASSARQGPV